MNDNELSVIVPEVLADEYNGRVFSYHSESSSQGNILSMEDEDAMRGVSNVLYHKEYECFAIVYVGMFRMYILSLQKVWVSEPQVQFELLFIGSFSFFFNKE